MESSQAQQEREKDDKNENRLQKLSNTIKHNNTYILGIPKREERHGEGHFFEEIITENIQNLGKETETEIQEAQRATNRNCPRVSTLRHIVIKMA